MGALAQGLAAGTAAGSAFTNPMLQALMSSRQLNQRRSLFERELDQRRDQFKEQMDFRRGEAARSQDQFVKTFALQKEGVELQNKQRKAILDLQDQMFSFFDKKTPESEAVMAKVVERAVMDEEEAAIKRELEAELTPSLRAGNPLGGTPMGRAVTTVVTDRLAKEIKARGLPASLAESPPAVQGHGLGPNLGNTHQLGLYSLLSQLHGVQPNLDMRLRQQINPAYQFSNETGLIWDPNVGANIPMDEYILRYGQR